MAQTGYTPISLYYSSTASNTPTAGNLVAGELAINTADGKLFYKDSAGVVQVIGTKGGVGSSTTTQVLYNSSGLVVGSANFVFDGTNVGIGTTSPASLGGGALLTVNQGSDANIIFARGGSTRQVQLGTSSTLGYINSDNTSGGLGFNVNGTNRAVIDTSGNVGIGTSSPTEKLTIVGNYKGADSSGNGVQIVNTTTPYIQAFATGGINDLQLNAKTIQFATGTSYGSASERMRIDSNGSLNIGTTTSQYGGSGLTVRTGTNSVNCVVTNQSQSALSAVNVANGTGTSASLVSFNVGSTGGSQVGTITYNGTIVQYNSTSDQRLKKNIVDAGSGLEKLANVKIRAFDWIDHNSHTDFGVIAQELNEVAPEAVSAGDIGETIERTWAVDTSTLVPAMIKAIQELSAEVNALKAKIGQ